MDTNTSMLESNVSEKNSFENQQNESEDKDVLDTQFAKEAYTYYQQEGSNDLKAIEIKVKITSSMIHPSLEE